MTGLKEYIAAWMCSVAYMPPFCPVFVEIRMGKAVSSTNVLTRKNSLSCSPFRRQVRKFLYQLKSRTPSAPPFCSHSHLDSILRTLCLQCSNSFYYSVSSVLAWHPGLLRPMAPPLLLRYPISSLNMTSGLPRHAHSQAVDCRSLPLS